MKRYGSVYLLVNAVTQEKYVGQTIRSIHTRWAAHKASAMRPQFAVHKNIAEYGAAAFSVQELFTAFCKAGLDSAEKQLIAGIAPKLNMTSGGAGAPRTHTAAECAARSLSAKQRWSDPVWKARTIEGLRGAVRNPDAIAAATARLKIARAALSAGRVKTAKPKKDRSATVAASWKNEAVRERRIAGLRAQASTPQAKAARSKNSSGRMLPADTIKGIAQSKWKPVYCKELEVSFLSQKHAAQYLGALTTSVANAVKQKGKVKGHFTLTRVA